MVSQQLFFEFPTTQTLDNQAFFVSDSNSEAYKWLNIWPQWPNQNLIIYGNQGCGKTHLAHIWQYKSAALLMNAHEFDAFPIENLLKENINLAIDDADTIQQEEKLFHIYNFFKASHNSLLLLGKSPPQQWNFQLPDLMSRLKTMTCVSIADPDDHLLTALLKKLFQDRQLKVDEGVIQFMIKYMERSFKESIRLVEELNQYALSTKRNITIPLIKDIMVLSASFNNHSVE